MNVSAMEQSVADKMNDKKKGIKENSPRDRKIDSKAAKPNAKAPLGQGGRFAALKKQLASKPGVTDPGALAASIGRKKYGKAKFQSLSKKGR